MSELKKALTAQFGILDHSEMDVVLAFFSQKTLKKGDFLLKTGQLSANLCFLNNGLLRIYAQTESREVTQWIATSGYFVTDLSNLLFDAPARWNIQALVDCELYYLSQEDYKKLGETLVSWHKMEKMFLAHCFSTLEDRIFSHLAMSAEERYHFFYEQQKELFIELPQHYLASILGMSPETFSRIRKKQVKRLS